MEGAVVEIQALQANMPCGGVLQRCSCVHQACGKVPGQHSATAPEDKAGSV